MREPVSALTNENVVWACPARSGRSRTRLGPRPPLGGLFFRSRPEVLPGGCTGSEEYLREELRRGVSSRPRCCPVDRAGEPLRRVCSGLKCPGARGLRFVSTRLRGPGSRRGSGGSAGAAEDGRGGRPGGSRVEPFAAALLPPTGVRPSHPWAETAQLQHPRAQYPG